MTALALGCGFNFEYMQSSSIRCQLLSEAYQWRRPLPTFSKSWRNNRRTSFLAFFKKRFGTGTLICGYCIAATSAKVSGLLI